MRPRYLALALLGLSACLPNRRPSLPFLERLSFAHVPDDSTLLYEAQANAHVLLVDRLPEAYDHISKDSIHTNVAKASRVILSPMTVIRQLNDSSAAVRTPSFMPRMSVEYLRVSRVGTVTPPVPFIGFPGANLTGARLSLAHHSNGQAGCFRVGYLPVDRHANNCRPRGGFDTTQVILNRADGDFSTTYLQMLIHSTWMNRGPTRQPTKSLGVAGGVDWHAPFLFGALTEEQRSLYGSWRAHAKVEGMRHYLHAKVEGMRHYGIACMDPGPKATACFLSGRLRLTGEYVRAPKMANSLADRIDPKVIPYRYSVEASHALDGLLGAGPFVRYVNGQDYYNIGFSKRRREIMWGLMLDASGPDRIDRQSRLP